MRGNLQAKICNQNGIRKLAFAMQIDAEQQCNTLAKPFYVLRFTFYVYEEVVGVALVELRVRQGDDGETLGAQGGEAGGVAFSGDDVDAAEHLDGEGVRHSKRRT
jgi:hypothetical protein